MFGGSAAIKTDKMMQLGRDETRIATDCRDKPAGERDGRREGSGLEPKLVICEIDRFNAWQMLLLYPDRYLGSGIMSAVLLQVLCIAPQTRDQTEDPSCTIYAHGSWLLIKNSIPRVGYQDGPMEDESRCEARDVCVVWQRMNGSAGSGSIVNWLGIGRFMFPSLEESKKKKKHTGNPRIHGPEAEKSAYHDKKAGGRGTAGKGVNSLEPISATLVPGPLDLDGGKRRTRAERRHDPMCDRLSETWHRGRTEIVCRREKHGGVDDDVVSLVQIFYTLFVGLVSKSHPANHHAAFWQPISLLFRRRLLTTCSTLDIPPLSNPFRGPPPTPPTPPPPAPRPAGLLPLMGTSEPRDWSAPCTV
ncbi:hypothetical protein B0J13DRAFT_517785 [Dactylonectria estremocensis]|uniref:Uncharacterized protein n=1 Tax=Dactylonectria estremocensis TaxID=1079267 RepID=A0A9P9FHT7_9HYPO|nr:hypothetical protein B0J13DRAFT_517785 [Dactylonectria estremocensis]